VIESGDKEDVDDAPLEDRIAFYYFACDQHIRHYMKDLTKRYGTCRLGKNGDELLEWRKTLRHVRMNGFADAMGQEKK